VGVGETFWINGSAEGEYNETFIGSADLVREGSIVDSKNIADGNVNFQAAEPDVGTSDFHIRFYNTTHYKNASTSNSTIIARSPTLTLDNVTNVASDWGINVSLNHSVSVTNATADDVNVTYNVSWILDDNMGSITEGGMKWHNQTCSNGTVQEITVLVNVNSTTASVANDSKTFNIDITSRDINITSHPVTPQSVDTGVSFWINASANDEHGDELFGKADLIKEGVVIGNQTISNGNVNFERTEPLAGTFNFSVRFYNTTHYNNETTSNSTVHIVDDLPPASITGLGNLTTGQSRIHWIWKDPADTDFEKVMIYIDGIFKTNVSRYAEHDIATGLKPNTTYTISTHTVVNLAWVNDTARTLQYSQSSSNRDGTYPPDTVTVTRSSSNTPAETPTPPGDRMMPAAANETMATEDTTAETPNKSIFWLIWILLLIGLLLIIYAIWRRRRSEES
jgi:hypothetical protein